MPRRTWPTSPFGDLINPGSQLPGERGYLNKPRDPDGSVRLDHRSYTPSLNVLITPDPLMTPTDPQNLNAYAYSGNNPITFADPTGLMRDAGNGGGHTTMCTGADGQPYANSSGGCGGGGGGNDDPMVVGVAIPGQGQVVMTVNAYALYHIAELQAQLAYQEARLAYLQRELEYLEEHQINVFTET